MHAMLLSESNNCQFHHTAASDGCLHRRLLFCGDQLTVERARNSQQNRVNSTMKKDALLGLLPIVSDWHAEANFLRVIQGLSRSLYALNSTYR